MEEFCARCRKRISKEEIGGSLLQKGECFNMCVTCSAAVVDFIEGGVPEERASQKLEALIKWRDGAAIDWFGEDLVFHVQKCLAMDDVPRVPPELEETLRDFRALDEDAQLRLVAQVLDIQM
jgi:hypothetical protein